MKVEPTAALPIPATSSVGQTSVALSHEFASKLTGVSAVPTPLRAANNCTVPVSYTHLTLPTKA